MESVGVSKDVAWPSSSSSASPRSTSFVVSYEDIEEVSSSVAIPFGAGLVGTMGAVSRREEGRAFAGPGGSCKVEVEAATAIGGNDRTTGDGERLELRIADLRGFISGEGTCITGSAGEGIVGVTGIEC